MKIERFYAYVTSLETGREEIKKLIDDTNKEIKKQKWYYCTTDIKINLTGILFERTISLERIENIKLVNDQLKISYSANVHNDISVEVSKKDTSISIPIKLINCITVEIH